MGFVGFKQEDEKEEEMVGISISAYRIDEKGLEKLGLFLCLFLHGVQSVL